MTEEIQKRIEAIKAGKVPDGYKKSIVGIVPSEWQEKRLSDLLRFQNGVNAEKEKFNSGIKMISVMDILDERPIVYDAIRGQVDIDEKALNNYSVTYGDILFQRSSETVEDAGKSNVYLDRDKTATYSGFVIRGKKIADYDPIYLNELLKTTGVRQQIIKYAAGSQHINVSQDSLARVRVCLASEEEQQRIGEVLLKWDKAIELQKLLIEKLDLQKRALMQKVLSPKKGWKKVKLNTILIPGSKEAVQDTSLYKKITIKLNFNGIEYAEIKRKMADTRPFFLRKAGEIIIGKQNYFNGSIALLDERFDGCICSNAIMSFSVNKLCNTYFVFKYLSQPDFMNKHSNLANGTGQKELSEKDFLNFEIALPPLELQEHIGNMLHKIDDYTEKQRKIFTGLNQQQKAIQQLLMTGIVRM